jgi:hypothetical protein
MIVGMALGLSTSPVLAGAITAGFALIGTLLPIYLPKSEAAEAPEEETTPKPKPEPPRPISVNVWLFPFATATALGMILGIALRVNDALDFHHDPSLREQFLGQGFTEQQTTEIMERLAKTIRDATSVSSALDSVATIQAKAKSANSAARETGLQANTSEGPFDWKGFWNQVNKAKFSDARKVEELKKLAPTPIVDEIKKLEEQSAESILKIVRGQHPEIGG